MAILAWLIRLEMSLETHFDREDWARETIKLLSDKAILNISPVDRYTDQVNGYMDLKEKLIATCIESLGHKKSVSLEDILSRKQKRNESARQYAQALRELAGDTFSSDDKLKDIFHRGLASQELQAVTARKLWDPAGKLSFNSLVTFTDTEEEVMKRTSNLLKSYQEASEKQIRNIETHRTIADNPR